MLTSYISEYLAPKNLRLEFKNRLENLCSLSGIPMSPNLRQWVIQTFGLEMVRFPMGYANLANYGGNIDFSLGAVSVQDILTLFLLRYQPQASVSVQDDGGGFFTITLNDFIYFPSTLNNSFRLTYGLGAGTDSFDLIEC